MRKQMFGHEITILRDTYRRLLRRHARNNLIRLINRTHPADLAILFRYFSEDEQLALFALMDPGERTVEFLSELDAALLTPLLSEESPQRIAELIREAGSNLQADILGALPEEQAQAILDLLKIDEQEEVQEIMGYLPDSAGGLMDTEVFTLSEDTLAKDAIATLQDYEQAELVFYLYVTDETGHLVGVISLRDLVTVSPNTELKDIMVKNVQAVSPETDQEEVARIVARYNYLAVPVLDGEDRLLGIVHVDDVVDVIREEATEDFLRMAGVGRDREILLKSPWGNAKSRLPWLFASWTGGIMAAYIIGIFENMLSNFLALAAFIPIVIGMGGNIGTQSSTIIVRGIATGRVFAGNAIKIILKELCVGLILGLFYGFLLGAVAHFQFSGGPARLGLVLALGISSSMLLAAAVGAVVPLLLNRLDIDPAIATGPFVTTSIDILGTLCYFGIASTLLGL